MIRRSDDPTAHSAGLVRHAADLQEIVDDLARQLDRGVAIDDRQMRLRVHSPHRGHVDSVRRESIMTRRGAPEAIDWALHQGIAEASDPVRLPPNRRIGAASRVGAPIRLRGLLLGFLWVLDEEQTLDADGLALCAAAAHEAAEVMYRQRLLDDAHRERAGELLQQLVGEEAAARAEAAGAIRREGLFSGQDVVAIAFGITDDDPDPDDVLELSSALERARRLFPPHAAMGVLAATHGLLLVEADALAARGGARRLDERLREIVDEELARAPAIGAVGCGERVALADARVSAGQAADALQLALRLPETGRVVHWGAAGVYRTLARLDLDEPLLASLPPGLHRLMDNDELVRTLATFLDNAGDVKETARELVLHRATLYYRLQRIEELTELDLKRGDDRLHLHLGLKLLRLTSHTAPPASRTKVSAR